MRLGRDAAMKRTSHGVTVGRQPGLIVSGPAGSMSQPGTRFSTPGRPYGTHEPGLIAPALPNEQYSPGGRMSTTVTSCPSRRRYAAQAMPTMPAPMTVMR
jgi:hypothetical protein